MSRASDDPLDWSAWALLLIDVQKDFWTPGHQQLFPGFPRSISRLLTFCRAKHIDVVHVHSRFRADRSDWMPPHNLLGSIPCIEGTGGDAVLPEAAPTPGEALFVKQTFDAFHLPELSSHLHAAGKRILLTAGLETSYCVLLTSTAACQHGFLTVMLEDSCADDPDFDPRATSAFLDRHVGKIFWRSSLPRLVDTHAEWMEKLAALDRLQDDASPC